MLKAEEYLQQLRTVDSEISAKLAQCEMLREMAARTSSMPVIKRGRRQNGRLEDFVAELFEIENELKYKVYG